jgi:predicted GIY-YIG superfamily endonuclease
LRLFPTLSRHSVQSQSGTGFRSEKGHFRLLTTEIGFPQIRSMSKTKFGPPWTPDAVAAEARRYKTRAEFLKKAYGAYDAARRRYHNLEEVCAHMNKVGEPKRHWTRERIQALVAQCVTYEEFGTKHPLARSAIQKNKWYDLAEHLPRKHRPPGYWTIERVKKEAAKYDTRRAFIKGSRAAYAAAHKRGWLDQVCSHMEYLQRPAGYWTKERVAEEARKYSTRTEFMKAKGAGYTIAAKNGWLDEVCAHMEKKGSQYERAIYAFEFEDSSVYVGLTFDYDVRLNEHRTQNKHIGKKLKHVPAKYVRFDEWMPLDKAGLEEARIIESYRERGWKILNRMKAGGLGSRPKKWSYDEIEKLAAKFKTVKAFKDAYPSAYAVACKHGWWGEISQHLVRAVEHGKWTLDALKEEAAKYSSRSEFEKKNGSAYHAARKKGWLNEVCGHMDCLVNPSGHWTKERVRDEALKYQSRVEFSKESQGAYQKASKNGWLDDVCGHMERLVKPVGYWDLERVKEEAKKYSTRGEFGKANPSAYQRARQKGWLDDVCGHMGRLRQPAGYWTREKVLEVAAQCCSLKEFRELHSAAQDAAQRLGLLPELRAVLKGNKKPNGWWTFERVAEEALKYSTRKEFARAAPGACNAARKNAWMDVVCAHMRQ